MVIFHSACHLGSSAASPIRSNRMKPTIAEKIFTLCSFPLTPYFFFCSSTSLTNFLIGS